MKPSDTEKTLLSQARAFQTPSSYKNWFYIISNFLGLASLWTLSYLSYEASVYWAGIIFSVLGGMFVMRLFIIQHDCGHGAYFKNQKLSNVIGRIISLVTLIPYDFWKQTHALHHAHNGNLDQRGTGDVSVMTLKEYQETSRFKRLLYRLYRRPEILFFLGPVFYFGILLRIPFGQPLRFKRAYKSILGTNLFLLILFGGTAHFIGLDRLALIFLPSFFVITSIASWLFYVQHQYENTYFSRKDNWNYTQAAIQGSSFYNLPRFLHWATGNIGYHHIHHLNYRIPFYRLPEAHQQLSQPELINKIDFWESFSNYKFKLWDEDSQKLVELKKAYSEREAPETHYQTSESAI